MIKAVHALRPYLPSDALALRELFAQSIEELTAEAYDEEQRLAWIETAEDAEAFAKRLASNLTLIAGSGGRLHGFASLKDNASLHMLYVHPFSTGQGVGTALADAIERIAGARGAAAISVDASDTALPFFEARGYVGIQRNARRLGDVWLPNTTMTKTLAAAKAPDAPKAMQ